VGPEFVEPLRATHAEYGRALGITIAAERKQVAVNLSEPLPSASNAISSYALQLLAHAAADERYVETVRAALMPIDKFRAAARRGAVGPADEPAPDAVIPSPPDGSQDPK